MTEHERIQMLISAYVDQELPDDDRQTVENHLSECQECQRFYKDVRRISSSLKSWTPETLSPDLEQRIASQVKARKSREEQTMRKYFNIPYSAVSTLVICMLVLTVSLRVYMKRNVQTAFKEAGDAVTEEHLVQETERQIRRKEDAAAVRSSSEIPETVEQQKSVRLDEADSIEIEPSRQETAPPVEAFKSARFGQKGERRVAIAPLLDKEEKAGPDKSVDHKDMSRLSGLNHEMTSKEVTARAGEQGAVSAGKTTGYVSQPAIDIVQSQVSSASAVNGRDQSRSVLFKGQAVSKAAFTGSAADEGGVAGQVYLGESKKKIPADKLYFEAADGNFAASARGTAPAGAALSVMDARLRGPAVTEEAEYWGDASSSAVIYPDTGVSPMRPGFMIVKPEEGWEEPYDQPWQDHNAEEYDRIYENEFLAAIDNPLSTFSIDVDTASYANIRRFLNDGQMPPQDAVRIEEMVNYFVYDYPQPDKGEPFSINTETAPCPWNRGHLLTMIGLQAKQLSAGEMPPSNLVFLVDVSGSMNRPNKLPLLKSALHIMVDQLREEERISIVTYAGQAGLVLESTPGYEKERIRQAIDRLQAGGSTAGEQGIQLAYRIAQQNFIPSGNNRVILATDGDFNIGISSDAQLVRVIEEKRDQGIFLSVLGFGKGNYKDSKMEKLADKGNGNYYYIDTLNEAQKVLGSELGSMLFPVAKDVKIQIEFNPSQVKAYRLIGYENRALAKEDFNDDTKDAGELGAGHTVTAFYEIVPIDSEEEHRKIDPLKYMRTVVQQSEDLMTVKLRYKDIQDSKSQLLTRAVKGREIKEPSAVSDNFRFGTAVAEFGLLLRQSPHKGEASYLNALQRAKGSLGEDPWGYRAEFIRLVEKAVVLDKGY